MIAFAPSEVAVYYATRTPHLKQHGKRWRGPCPIHGGKKDSFSVDPDTGLWCCWSDCGRGGDILELEEALNGGDFPTRKAEVFRLVGRIEPEYYRPNGKAAETTPVRPAKAAGLWREVARYAYVDPHENVLFEVIRQERGKGDERQKRFLQRRPNGKGGWIWNLDGVERIPYLLPNVLKADTVYLAEGEKDAHTLQEWGLVGSCNPGGSAGSNLYAGWAEYFRGKHIVILPDNDEPGRKHAAAKAAALLSGAASVRVVELPDLPVKGDVTDWRDAGGTLEQFRELTDATAPLDSAALSELRARWVLAGEGPNCAGRAEAGSLVTRRLSDINAKPVSWLWPGRIARGKVSIIAGNPGFGKSQVTASIAAIVTTGGQWPVDRSQCQPGEVIFLSAEDDPADTIRPRLEAAGANLHRVHVMDAVISGYTGEGQKQIRAFSLQRDIEALSTKLTELGDVAAVVIDPITAYLGDVDSHRNAEVRALLAPLSELAARHDTAIIGVSHLSKSAGPEVLMRVNGSLAFVAAARAAYLVAPDPENRARRFFLPMKNNIGPDATGLAFHIEGANVQSSAGPVQTSLVVWDSEPVTTTADEVMRPQVPQRGSALREAEEWLQQTLSRPVPAAEIFRMASDVGISRQTLRRASESLRITKEKTGMKEGWVWVLPPKMPTSSEGAQQNSLGTFDNDGHLRSVAEVEIEI